MKWSSFKRNFAVVLILGLAILGLVASSANAQTGTTSLRGIITDRSGATISGAKVTLSNAQQGSQREDTSGSSGEYEFLALQPGTYTLAVESSGFRKYEQTGLQLLVNSPSTVNVTLEVGSTTQTVEVSAQAATINTSDASLGIAFGERQVKELPMEYAVEMNRLIELQMEGSVG